MLVLAGKPGRLNPNKSENKSANIGQKGEIATKLIMPREMKLNHIALNSTKTSTCQHV